MSKSFRHLAFSLILVGECGQNYAQAMSLLLAVRFPIAKANGDVALCAPFHSLCQGLSRAQADFPRRSGRDFNRGGCRLAAADTVWPKSVCGRLALTF
jgi:hypothetical protein